MANVIDDVRKQEPLIHHLTNQVVMNFTANGLLAFGGSPIMSKEKKEAEAMAQIADGVLINIGTALEYEREAMLLAGKKANEKGIPVVLDPVGVAASSFRQETIEMLLEHISFTAIKGNAGEMAHLVQIDWKTKGVDSQDGNVDSLAEIAQLVAEKYGTLAVVTGEVDVVSYQGKTVHNKYGHPLLTKVTGAGCLLGSVLTACLTTNFPRLEAAYEAVAHYGKAAEKAAEHEAVSGSGTFIPHFLDALAE